MIPISHTSEDNPEMRKLQETIKALLKAEEKQAKPDADQQKAQSLQTQHLFQRWEQLVSQDGVLFKQWESKDDAKTVYQLVMPKSECENVLRDLHEKTIGCHLGESKVLEKLKERFYCPRHARDVKNWCQTCSACAQQKHPTPKNKANFRWFTLMQIVVTDILCW